MTTNPVLGGAVGARDGGAGQGAGGSTRRENS